MASSSSSRPARRKSTHSWRTWRSTRSWLRWYAAELWESAATRALCAWCVEARLKRGLARARVRGYWRHCPSAECAARIPGMSRARILIVDDLPEKRLVYSSLLEDLDAE